MLTLTTNQNITIIEGVYSIPLVILSILIACFASFIALSINERLQENSFFHKSLWLTMASFSMGLGIWSMHFIGMSALMLQVPMSYNLPLTIISIIPAILSSYVAFYISNRSYSTRWPNIFAGIAMGIGISSMHYIGMAAMVMEAEYSYIPWIFAASILIAIFVSYVALYIFSKLQNYMKSGFVKGVTSIIMGSAVASMHYTGMFAVTFYTVGTPVGNKHLHKMDMAMLIIGVSVGISILLLVFGLSILLDRYVDYRLKYFHPITLLPNQKQFESDIQQSQSGRIALIHLHDLEKWTSKYGYSFADSIMMEVSKLIEKEKPESAKVYHIEANRYAVMTTNPAQFNQLETAMESVAQKLRKSSNIQNQNLIIEMVCAISNPEKLVISEAFSNAISVLQHPAIRYHHEVIEYDPAIHTYTFEKSILQDIDRAIIKDELFLMYQPKICSQTKQIVGVEALIRWQHPEHGLIPPNVFIPIMEEHEKIFDVTDWVIEKACSQIAKWKNNGLIGMPLSINVPGPYITSQRLLQVLNKNVHKYNINSDDIELEITETSVVKNIKNAEKAIEQIRSHGFLVAMDDFGTGVSSLSYLKRLAITTLKVDKSFVDGIPFSEKDSAIMNAIISLCSTLQLNVVIEGVELEEQVEFFRSTAEKLAIQGYYYSKPLQDGEFSEWVAQFNQPMNTVS